MTQVVKLHVNGADYELALDTRTTLVDALRDHLRQHTPDGCCILVKGSRTNHLETVVGDL